MNTRVPPGVPGVDIAALIAKQAQDLSARLDTHRRELFPPTAEKPLRSFQLHDGRQICGPFQRLFTQSGARRQRAGAARELERSALLYGRTNPGIAGLSRPDGLVSRRYIAVSAGG